LVKIVDYFIKHFAFVTIDLLFVAEITSVIIIIVSFCCYRFSWWIKIFKIYQLCMLLRGDTPYTLLGSLLNLYCTSLCMQNVKMLRTWRWLYFLKKIYIMPKI